MTIEECVSAGRCNGVAWRIYRVEGRRFRLEVRFEGRLVYRREFASLAEAESERGWPSRVCSLD